MMFINKTLLQKEHIRIPDNDWTWDEFYSLCEQLTRDTDGDGIVDQFGVYDYGWEEALVANGCPLFSEDGQHCLLTRAHRVPPCSLHGRSTSSTPERI
mgnify:CR=1 FL=1